LKLVALPLDVRALSYDHMLSVLLQPKTTGTSAAPIATTLESTTFASIKLSPARTLGFSPAANNGQESSKPHKHAGNLGDGKQGIEIFRHNFCSRRQASAALKSAAECAGPQKFGARKYGGIWSHALSTSDCMPFESLLVADASVMPTMPSGKTYLGWVMVAERIARKMKSASV